MNDLVPYHQMLLTNHHGDKNIRSELVTQFLNMVDSIRVLFERSDAKMTAMYFPMRHQVMFELQSRFKMTAQALAFYLRPSYIFGSRIIPHEGEMTGSFKGHVAKMIQSINHRATKMVAPGQSHTRIVSQSTVGTPSGTTAGKPNNQLKDGNDSLAKNDAVARTVKPPRDSNSDYKVVQPTRVSGSADLKRNTEEKATSPIDTEMIETCSHDDDDDDNDEMMETVAEVTGSADIPLVLSYIPTLITAEADMLTALKNIHISLTKKSKPSKTKTKSSQELPSVSTVKNKPEKKKRRKKKKQK